MNETLSAEGMWSVLNYTFIPFGNSYYPQADCPGSKIYSRDKGVPCWQLKCGNATAQPPECFEGDFFVLRARTLLKLFTFFLIFIRLQREIAKFVSLVVCGGSCFPRHLLAQKANRSANMALLNAKRIASKPARRSDFQAL